MNSGVVFSSTVLYLYIMDEFVGKRKESLLATKDAFMIPGKTDEIINGWIFPHDGVYDSDNTCKIWGLFITLCGFVTGSFSRMETVKNYVLKSFRLLVFSLLWMNIDER